MIGVRFSENKCCRNSQCKKVLWLSMLLLTSFIIGCEDQERNNVTWGWGSLVERYSFPVSYTHLTLPTICSV